MKILQVLKANYLLVIILLVATLLRFVAVKPGYNPYHGDETAIWGSSIQMVKKATFDPGRYDYPATTMYINVFADKVFFVPISWMRYYLSNLGRVVDGTLKVFPNKLEKDKLFTLYIAGEREINALFWTRYVTALFGVGSVFLTYLLGKKVFSKEVGLLASVFLTFNYRNVMNSHLALPDIYNAFFLLLALITAWDLWEKPSRKSYLMAGLAAGVAFSVKYQFFGIIPIIAAHLFLTFKGKFSLRKLFDGRVVAAGFCILLVFFLTNPYFFMNLETAIIKMNEEFRKYGVGTNQLNLFPLSYLFHIDYGPSEFILVLLGLVVGVFRKTLKTVFFLLLIIPIFYVFIYYTHGGFYVRNFIPVTTVLLIFAALGLWELVGKRVSLWIFIPLVILVMYFPAKNSIFSSYGYTKPWGFETLSPWLKENLPEDVIVGSHPFDRSVLGIKNKTTEFAPTESFSLAEHTDNNVSFIILNFNWASLPFYFWMDYGFDRITTFWNKPLNLLRNTFHGIAAEEMIRYQIHTVTKPWQSPDMHFVVVKIPKWPEAKMRQMKKFVFDRDKENWQVYGKWNPEEEGRFKYDSGTLMFSPGSLRFPTIRITSQPIPINPGYLYEVSASLRSEVVLASKERDGFVRIDFYDENPNLEDVGISASVSSRVYGTNEWTEKSITQRAPENAKYLTVSFQTYSSTTKIWFDNVKILESETKVQDITSFPPFTKDFIDLNYLYPNSHGNL